MKKIGSFLRGIMYLFLMTSAVGVLYLFAKVRLGKITIPVECLTEPEFQPLYTQIANEYIMTWSYVFLWIMPLIVFMLLCVWMIKGTAGKNYICMFATAICSVSCASYVVSSILLTKTVSVCCMPLSIIAVFSILYFVICVRAHRHKMLQVEGSKERVRRIIYPVLILTGFVIVFNFGSFCKVVDSGRYDDYIAQKISTYTYRYFHVMDPKFVTDPISVEPKFEVTYVNMFSANSEKFTMEEIEEAFKNLESGEGSWYRLIEFEEAYDSIKGLYNQDALYQYRECVMDELLHGEKAFYDYTLEDVEVLMKEIYLEMENELKK